MNPFDLTSGQSIDILVSLAIVILTVILGRWGIRPLLEGHTRPEIATSIFG